MEERFVAQRTRLFAEMTWPEVAEAAGRGAGVVLPVGSTEQHGYHLPLATDAILATELAAGLLDGAPDRARCAAWPASRGQRRVPRLVRRLGFVQTGEQRDEIGELELVHTLELR